MTMASKKQKQQLCRAHYFSGFKYWCWKKQHTSFDHSQKIPPSTDKVSEINSNLTSVHGFMSPPAWPSPVKSFCVWAALGGCHTEDTYPQSVGSKSNFCANHRGLIKILIETKHKWQLAQLYQPSARSVYIFGLRRSYFYQALKSCKADGDFSTSISLIWRLENLKRTDSLAHRINKKAH